MTEVFVATLGASLCLPSFVPLWKEDAGLRVLLGAAKEITGAMENFSLLTQSFLNTMGQIYGESMSRGQNRSSIFGTVGARTQAPADQLESADAKVAQQCFTLALVKTVIGKKSEVVQRGYTAAVSLTAAAAGPGDVKKFTGRGYITHETYDMFHNMAYSGYEQSWADCSGKALTEEELKAYQERTTSTNYDTAVKDYLALNGAHVHQLALPGYDTVINGRNYGLARNRA